MGKAMLAKLNSSGQPQIALAPYDHDIKGNPVGRLQEMCMARRIPPPTYGSHHEEGEPHQKSFHVHCNIEGRYKETGTGKNKKMAKRQAAYKIIIKLSEIPVKKEDFLENDDDELAQEHNLKYSELEETDLKNQNPSKRVSLFHKNLQCFKGKQISMLQQKQLENKTDLGYWKKLLRSNILKFCMLMWRKFQKVGCTNVWFDFPLCQWLFALGVE